MPSFAIWQFFHLVALLYWVGGLILLGFYWLPRWPRMNPSRQAWENLQEILKGFSLGGVIAASLLLLSGYAMVLGMGGFAVLSPAIWLMVILGTMVALGAFHLFFAAHGRLRKALAQTDMVMAAKSVAKYAAFARFLAILSFLLTLIGVLGVYR